MKNIIKLLLLASITVLWNCGSDESGCAETTWYEDADGDGLGNPDVSQSECEQPNGYVANNTDTDDTLGNSGLSVDLASCNTQGLSTQSELSSIESVRASIISFLNSLDQTLVNNFSLCLDDDEVYSWTNTPGPRTGGIELADLTEAQRVLAFKMLEAFLSDQGYAKIEWITQTIEEHLSDQNPQAWGIEYYTMALFGDPESDGSWGFQFDGHHCALNFLVHGDQITLAPAFIGCEPAELNGVMILENELNLGQSFYDNLNTTQQSDAFVAGLVGEDVVVGAGSNSNRDDNRNFDYSVFNNIGLALLELSTEQTSEMRLLIEEYINYLDEDFTGTLLTEIESSLSTGFYAYSKTDARIYYRIYIPNLLLIEYDDPANFGGGNTTSTTHQHTITRLLNGDALDDYGVFAVNGPNTILEHYLTADHHKKDLTLFALELIFKNPMRVASLEMGASQIHSHMNGDHHH